MAATEAKATAAADATAALQRALVAAAEAEDSAATTLGELAKQREVLARVQANAAFAGAAADAGRGLSRDMARREGWRGWLPWNWR